WVLNLTRSVKYSDADRAEIQRQLTEQYISDYTATWRAGMDNLNIRNFESPLMTVPNLACPSWFRYPYHARSRSSG
ncbi:hypothetical protein O5281_27225, partial [Escherichia coli]|nr:hypothetical protein [Escherichia coli]